MVLGVWRNECTKLVATSVEVAAEIKTDSGKPIDRNDVSGRRVLVGGGLSSISKLSLKPGIQRVI